MDIINMNKITTVICNKANISAMTFLVLIRVISIYLNFHNENDRVIKKNLMFRRLLILTSYKKLWF